MSRVLGHSGRDTQFRRWFLTIAVLAGLFCVAKPARAQSHGPFSEGRVRVSALVGAGSFGGQRSTIIGANVGYFVLDGLQVGLEGDVWIGGNAVARLSPSVTYTLVALPTILPYAGAFYRHWFTESPFSDLDTLGVRGGINWIAQPGAFFSLGLAYEAQVSPECPSGADCGYLYPEIAAAFSF